MELPNYSALDLKPISQSIRKYRKYPSAVKDEVSKTKNIYLFPDLKIPRTTAQYWVKRQRPFRTADVVEIESIFRKKSEYLEGELAKERAMRKLLETVRKVFPYDFRVRSLKNKQSRAQIIAAIHIQAVIDNFSRFILAWTVTDTIDAKTTVDTLAKARQKANALLNTYSISNVMMDPGKENKNDQVQKFITSRNLKRIIAQTDIHYSNSMIEGLFRGLKNRYLYHQKIKSIDDLSRKANFYFKQHNEVVPLNVLKGGRPKEVFLSNWGDFQRSELQLNKERAFQREVVSALSKEAKMKIQRTALTVKFIFSGFNGITQS